MKVYNGKYRCFSWFNIPILCFISRFLYDCALFLVFIIHFFLLSFLALFARLLGALIHSAAVAAVCSAQQGTGSSLALIPTRIAAVWLSVVLDRINSKLAEKKPRLRINVRNLGKKIPSLWNIPGRNRGEKERWFGSLFLLLVRTLLLFLLFAHFDDELYIHIYRDLCTAIGVYFVC